MSMKIKAMGKCIKRTLHNSKKNSIKYMTREDAVSSIFKTLKKENIDFEHVVKTISLFGITAEELGEAGVSYENLKALGSLID